MDNASPKFRFSSRLRTLRDRRASRIGKPDADFLAQIAAETIIERLGAINRSFDIRADVLSRFDAMQSALEAIDNQTPVQRIGGHSQSGHPLNWEPQTDALPLEPGSQELITSVYGLHRTNDLPNILMQIRFALKPDGLFMAALPGPQTLQELRLSLIEAETELNGGATMRVDPFGTLQQYGGILQQCGFALPVIDNETLTIRYGSMRDLIDDLRAMGSTLTSASTASSLTRGIYARACEIYSEKFSDADGRIRATFECIYLSGWAPHKSQQQPLRPGSAKTSLSEALSAKEVD